MILISPAAPATVIKIIEALRHGVRPPNRRVDTPTAALDGTPFRLLQQAEVWPKDAPRIAAISAFGFGGNNAHLIVSTDDRRPFVPRSGSAALVIASSRFRPEKARRPLARSS